MEEKTCLKWYNKVGYGTGDIAGNVVYAFLSSFVMIYLTNTVGLNSGIVGTLIAVSKLFDGVTDIFFGTMIDHTKSKMGKARPWMFYGFFGCAITLFGVFAIPTSLGKTAQYAWFFIAYTLLNAVFYTANNIAYGTQTITLTDNEGYSIYLSVTVNANHTMDNSDCTKESICSVCGKIFLAQANHKFSDTWTKDDTYHWKVCENDGCTVTTTKTKHSGTDDGDCTTPVICECGEIVTAAKSEHIYGEWKSNGNGTHTHKCTTAGCIIEETESCVGGAATCKKRAVCTDCNAEYGTLNPANHSGNQVWVQTEKTHQKKYDCCGAEVTNIADHIWENGHCTVCGYDCIHTGGEATCTQKAVCDTCHSEYGEINADNHSGVEKWIQTATTHEKRYDCCGKVTMAQENHKWKDGACETCGYVCVHSGGEATCTKGAVCETCGREYTDKDMANHSGKVVWVQTEKTHKQAYDCCDKEVSTSEAHVWKNGVCTVCDYQCKHAGGSATCVKKAVCTICSEEYGTYNMSIHEGLKSVAAKAATRTDEGNIEYWYCKDCDRYYIKQDGLVEIEKSRTVVVKITDTTSSDDTGKGGKTETVKEQTPDTGDNKRVFAWLLMFIIGGAAAGLTIKGKKTEN